MRPGATTLDPQTLQKLVDAFEIAMQRAIAPLRADLAAMNATWKDLAATPSAAPPARSPGASPLLRRGQAAIVEISTRREPLPSAGEFEHCVVPECDAPVLAKQLCETHYRIMRRTVAAGAHFDPESQRPARARAAHKLCEETGCDEAHYAKGLCRRHYMAVRSRIRAAEKQGQPLPDEAFMDDLHTPLDEPEIQEEETPTPFTPRGNGSGDRGLDVPLFQESSSSSLSPKEALPTAEMVSRVVAQYRGGLDRVAEVLGRNKRTLMELLDRLDLMPFVTRLRKEERQRIESAPLRDRLDDLLFREKLIEDLGCLKEIDDRARFEIKMRCANLAKDCDTIEDVLHRLSGELNLDEGGMKRLVWRYDLRRYLRGLKLKQSGPPVRTRV